MITRRRFLRAGLLGGALLGTAALVGRQLTGYALDEATRRRLRVLTPKEYLVFAATARRILAPDGADALDADQAGVALFVDGYLTQVDKLLVRDLRALLHLLEHGSGLFRGQVSRFTRMSPADQDAALADWESSRLVVRRRGLQVLRTLAFLGYYRDARTWPMLGYSGPMLPPPPVGGQP